MKKYADNAQLKQKNVKIFIFPEYSSVEKIICSENVLRIYKVERGNSMLYK